MIIKQALISWPHLASPSTKFNADGTYEVLAEVSDADATTLREKGITVKSEDGKNTTTFRKKAKNKKGEDMSRPQVVHADLSELSTNEMRSIGNGTECNIRLRFYDWTFNGRSGTSAVLEGIQITKLVAYEQGAAEEFTAVEVNAEQADNGMY